MSLHVNENVVARRRRRRGVQVMAIAAVALLAVSACSSSTSSSKKSTALTMAVPEIPANTDPQQHDSAANQYWVSQTVGTLTQVGRVPASNTTLPGAAAVNPFLATSWKVGPSGITFTLRKATSQYGNPLTADDVKWSFDRVLPVKDPVTPYFASVAGVDLKNPVTVVDAHTVRVNATPNALTLNLLAYKGFNVYDATEAKKHATASDPIAKAWLATHTATFGPYETTAITPNQVLRLQSNPHYYGTAPSYKTVVLRAVPSSSSSLQLLKSGNVDWAHGLNVNDFTSLKGQKNFETPTLPSVSSACLCFTTGSGPFQNVALRQAASLALNRQQFIQGPWKGLATLPHGFVSNAFTQSVKQPAFDENLTKAKSLVASANLKKPVTLGYADIGFTGIGVDVTSVAVLVKSQLDAAGFNVTLVKVPDAEYFADAGKHKFDMFFDLIGGTIADQAYALNLSFGSKGFLNFMGYSNPALDKILGQALTVTGPRRNQLAAQAQSILRTDMPATLLVDPRHYEAYRAGITGLTPTAGDLVFVSDLKPKA